MIPILWLSCLVITWLNSCDQYILPDLPEHTIEGKVVGPDGPHEEAEVVLIDSVDGNQVADYRRPRNGEFIFGVIKDRTFLLIASDLSRLLKPDTCVVRSDRDVYQVLYLRKPSIRVSPDTVYLFTASRDSFDIINDGFGDAAWEAHSENRWIDFGSSGKLEHGDSVRASFDINRDFLEPGVNLGSILVKDDSGNEDALYVHAVSPPSVKILEPKLASNSISGTVDVELDLSNDVHPDSIQFFIDGCSIEFFQRLGAYRWKTWAETDGMHTFAAKVSSKYGLSSKDSVLVDIQNARIWSGMALIPSGSYLRGREDAPNDAPPSTITLSAFYIDRFEATNALYAEFVEETGHPKSRFYENPQLNRLEQPVVGVKWEDAREFCEWAGKRLPTEAEWERAAKGTKNYKYPWSDEEPTPDKANYGGYIGFPVEGDRFAPNSDGLYNMAGNVAEWVADIYNADYYRSSPSEDPPGPEGPDATMRVIRGGSWKNELFRLETSRRFSLYSLDGYDFVGFRCARDVCITTRP